jgi:hypothetical protein
MDLAQKLVNMKYHRNYDIREPRGPEKWYGRLREIREMRQERGQSVLPFKYLNE